MIAETSINGYIASADKHEAQRITIVKELKKHPEGMTRRMLSKATGIENSAVSARARELVKVGALTEPVKDKCPITGITVKWLFVREAS